MINKCNENNVLILVLKNLNKRQYIKNFKNINQINIDRINLFKKYVFI